MVQELRPAGRQEEPAVEIPAAVRAAIQDRFESRDFELPVLPAVVSEVLTACRDANSDARLISDLLHRDQAIAGNVMRLANSTMFGGTVRITSLQQAISRLGFRTLMQIVITVSTGTRMFEVPERWESAVGKNLRRTSYLAALFCKEIARMRRANVETAFLAGLLHDMGKPVLCALLVDIERLAGQEFDLPTVVATLDVFHPEIGALLAASWDLPNSIAKAIRHQSNWRRSGFDTDGMAATVDLARGIAADLVAHRPLEVESLDVGALDALDLYRDDAENLCRLRDTFLSAAKEL